MEQIKYSKEGAKNYLILPCINGKEDDFQVKMMERGNIQRCLPCKLRHINGSTHFYYDITSKISLKNYRNGKKWKREQITQLLNSIDSAQEELRKYLLAEDFLSLDPDLIFYDFDTKDFYFLFYPVGDGSMHSLEGLLEYLLDNLDHQDEATSNIMYEVFEEAENGVLSIQRLKKKLDDLEEKNSDKENNAELSAEGREPFRPTSQEEMNWFQSDEDSPESTLSYGTGQTTLEKKGKGNQKYYLILMAVACLAEAAALSVLFLVPCSSREQMILSTVCIVLGILCVIFAYLYMKERKLQKRKELYNESLVDFREQDFLTQAQPQLREVKMEDFLYKGSRQTYEVPVSGDETVFFAPEVSQEKKLYALDKKNKVHISLETLPCTIGKANEMVDYCIKDNSVSRMHAKIEERGGHFILTDLNSTNGTFVNGLQMSPNEQVEIERGDEIRFGKMRYSFR